MPSLILMASAGPPMESASVVATSPGADPLEWKVQWPPLEAAWLGPVALAVWILTF